MNVIFDNGAFRVEADEQGNVYRVINLKTNILEETNTSEYEAVRYAIVHKNAIYELMNRDHKAEGSWPKIEPEKVN